MEVMEGDDKDVGKEKPISDCPEKDHLVTAAEKIKQIEEENMKLRNKLEKDNQVTNELIENITQEKLNLVTQIDALKKYNKRLEQDLDTCRVKIDTCSDENIAYKRQITRLTDENEQLISDLESLDSKLQKLNGLGIEQQQQLLLLEEAKIQEQKLSETIQQYTEEIKCLKNENNVLISKVENLNATLISRDSDIADLLEQLSAKKNIISDLTKKLDYSKELKEHNDKLRDKIKLYHSKIIKIAGNAKHLKADRNFILKLLKTYNSQVVSWKENLDAAQNSILMQIKFIETENSQLKQTLHELNKNTISSEEMPLDGINYSSDVKKLHEDNISLTKDNERLVSERNLIEEQSNSKISELELKILEADKEIRYLNTHKENSTQEIVEHKNIQIKLNSKIEQLNQEIEKLSNHNESLIKTDEELLHPTDNIHTTTVNSIWTQTEEILDSKHIEKEDKFTNSKEKADTLLENSETAQEKTEIDVGKYEKLRELAIKLKGKIRELTQKNEELQKRCGSNIKTIQNIQGETDKLQDELEKYKKECRQHIDNINVLANDLTQCKLQLATKDETIRNLQSELETIKNDKTATDSWKKQVSIKVQSLRKELDANNLVKKEFESTIAKLNNELELKEQLLKSEIENHKKTRIMLDQSNNECKKHSTLSLEIEDYEHSVKEIAKKLEKRNEEVAQMNAQIESQKATITALRDQNKLLEEKTQMEESNSKGLLAEITTYKKKINSIEEEIFSKDEKIQTLNQSLEKQRSEMEELSTELSKAIAEHQKVNLALRLERDNLLSRNLGIEQGLREAQDNLKLKEEELKATQNEYEQYKLRVQSVLKQNQTRDIGNEERLFEEISSLMAQNTSLKSQLEENCLAKDKIQELQLCIEQLTAKNGANLQRIKDLETSIEDLQNHYSELSANYEKTVTENAETIGSLKVHADTLSQRYRQKISEQESRHVKEIMELQNRLTPTESPVVLIMPREEGEGSESVESTNESNQHHPVPLEHLLASNFDQERVTHLEKLVGDQENKLVHLTALLAETEQELARYVQMNALLKEEIRRQQRSEEREKHAENLEYLKNVIFKFLSLNSGDERIRLVPVINTILKLSPEETKQLLAVAKGEFPLRGWTNLLSGWSPSKPY